MNPIGPNEGRDRRDEGIRRRIENDADWHNEAGLMFHGWLEQLPPETEFTSDGFRAWTAIQGLPEPSHPNSWGALFNTARQAGLIRDTGKVRKTTRASGHARRIVVWAKTPRLI